MPFGQQAVDWQERIDVNRLRRERKEKAREAAKEHGLDALLLFHGDNVRYVAMRGGVHLFMTASGYRYTLFPVDGEPILYEVGMRKPWTEDSAPWLDVEYAVPVMSYLQHNSPPGVFQNQVDKFVDQIASEAADHGVETIGLDVGRPQIQAGLEDEGFDVTTEGARAMTEARTIKTEDEINCLRMTASVVESIIAKFVDTIEPGVTELDLRGLATKTAYEHGADWGSAPNINSGPNSAPVAVQASDRMLRHGDLICAALCNMAYNGYRSCYYRTFSVGEPTEAQEEAYQVAYDTLYDAIDLIEPGVTTAELAEKFLPASELGRPNEDSGTLMQWGHGIGLGLYEPPMVNRIWSLDYPVELEENMTIALETHYQTDETEPLYPRGQGVRIEEMIRVTENGAELLSKWPVEEITSVPVN
ncbi:MAG: M24 family metallopeptidase [Halobacteriales archaeon]